MIQSGFEVPRRILLCAAFMALCAYSTVSRAVTLSFFCITNNNAADCATGQAQLTAEVVSLGSNVLFWFKNTGANASSITDVYFDDGSLLALAGLIDADQNTSTYGPTYVGHSGVDFTQQAVNNVSPIAAGFAGR